MCIEQKAPRGRPAKAKKALEYQPPVTQDTQAQATNAKASKRKDQDTGIQLPPKKRARQPKPTPFSEAESEPITEPETSNL